MLSVITPHRVGPPIDRFLGAVILEMGVQGVVTIPFFFFLIVEE